MAEALTEKRKFILALGDEAQTELVSKLISDHVGRAQIVTAEDGKTLLHKIDNDPPHVVILRDDLPKMRGYEVIESVFYKGPRELAVIFVNDIPERLELADQVATGQFQFVPPDEVEKKIVIAVSRALSWLARGDTVDFTLRFLKAGEYLMRQGEAAETVYILKSGHMKAYLHSEVVSHGVLLGEIEPKEFVGEMAYISGDVRSADVVADTDCELIEIPIPHLDRLLFQKPAWAKALMKTLSKRMKVANETLTAKA